MKFKPLFIFEMANNHNGKVSRGLKLISEITKQIMRNLLTTVSVAGVDEACIRNALESDWSDFEDSVQHEVAQQIKAEIIITRNESDYKDSAVRVMSPADFLSFAKKS